MRAGASSHLRTSQDVGLRAPLVRWGGSRSTGANVLVHQSRRTTTSHTQASRMLLTTKRVNVHHYWSPYSFPRATSKGPHMALHTRLGSPLFCQAAKITASPACMPGHKESGRQEVAIIALVMQVSASPACMGKRRAGRSPVRPHRILDMTASQSSILPSTPYL